MPLPNGQPGVNRNPLLVSPYTQSMSLGINVSPPGSEFRITDGNEYRITDNNQRRITD